MKLVEKRVWLDVSSRNALQTRSKLELFYILGVVPTVIMGLYSTQAEKGAARRGCRRRQHPQLEPGRLAGPAVRVPTRPPRFSCKFTQVVPCQWCQRLVWAGCGLAQPATSTNVWYAGQRRRASRGSTCQVSTFLLI